MGVGQLRRNRGYAYEHRLVIRFKKCNGYDARRLGGSSTGFPDVVVTNNRLLLLIAIEAKSGQGTDLYVPADQVERCHDICAFFAGGYVVKKVVLAFWFMGKTKKVRITLNGQKARIEEKRELREFYFDVTTVVRGHNFKCNYAGQLFAMKNKEQNEVIGARVRMPFEKK